MNRKSRYNNRRGNFLSVKTGRVPSLMQGVVEIIAGVFVGVIWINIADQTGQGVFRYFHYAGYVVILIAILGGSYHIYNALAKNRFSEQDVVFSGQEPDPFSRFLDDDELNLQTSNTYCETCGNTVNEGDNFCPGCGKDVR